MLTHPTVEKLHELRCAAMARALAEQLASPQVQDLSFEERLGLLVDREITERHSRLTVRVVKAGSGTRTEFVLKFGTRTDFLLNFVRRLELSIRLSLGSGQNSR